MTDCVICPPERHRPAEPHKLVCFHCSNRVLRHLGELEDYLPTLSLLKTRGGDGGGRKPGFGSASPANDTVIHHTDWRTAPSALDGMGAVATVHEWAKQVREDRGLDCPRTLSVFGELHALRTHHAWIMNQPWVADYAGEVREIHAAVRAAANDPIPRAVGRCIAMRRNRECGADVYELPDASGVKCSDRECARVYTGLDLDRLRVAQEAS
jgi:hypothetical protein